MRNTHILALLSVILVFSGCTVTRPVSEDYHQYLVNNKGSSNLPKTRLKADYQLTPQTTNHRYEFRAASAGAANLWIVEFGKMLDNTLQSADVQAAFGKLQRENSGGASNRYVIVFDLRNYEYKDHRAHISLNISVKKGYNTLFDKTYDAQGKSQTGKTLFGGVFAMKNSVQQSTKLALDDILTKFINQVNAKSRKR